MSTPTDWPELDEILDDYTRRIKERQIYGVSDDSPRQQVETALTTYINKEKAKAELLGRIDELENIQRYKESRRCISPQVISIYWEKFIPTEKIKERIEKLNVQLAKDKEDE